VPYFNNDHFEKFARFLFDHAVVGRNGRPAAGVVEFICYGGHADRNGYIVPSTHGQTVSGWFDDHNRLGSCARRLRGVSGYVTVNPVTPELLAVCPNKVSQVRKGEATNKDHIVYSRNLLIDIDVGRVSSRVSSTDAELRLALDVRDRILDTYPAIRDHAVWGCSGNGGYILIRRPDRRKPALAVREDQSFLRRLADKFGKKKRDKVYIGTNTFLPNIHMGLPGTLKCKGLPGDERPHRPVTVDS
jgi:hypothetical protein